MDADAADVVISELHLAGVDPDVRFDAEPLHALDDRLAGADGSRRTVECRERAVAGGLDQPAAELFDRGPHDAVVIVEHVAPPPISQRDGPLGRRRRCR